MLGQPGELRYTGPGEFNGLFRGRGTKQNTQNMKTKAIPNAAQNLQALNLMFAELMKPTIRENEIIVPATSWWWNKIQVQDPQGEVYYIDRSTERKFLGEESHLFSA